MSSFQLSFEDFTKPDSPVIPDGSRVVAWFSCGAASAVAAKLALDKYSTTHEIHVVYCDTSRNEHPDNLRFRQDIQNWLNYPITIISSPDFQTVEQVVAKHHYISGPKGARCTTELKKIPRFLFQRPDDIHIFGYTYDEKRRVREFTQRNPELRLDWILISNQISKAQTLKIIQQANIPLPAMYKLGFKNNNCIGCLKVTSPTYWLRIQKFFPDIFDRRVQQSRQLNVKMVEKQINGSRHRFFLDQLTPDLAQDDIEPDVSCGPACGIDPE